MNNNIHISLAHFLEALEKRLGEYKEALFGTGQMHGMQLTMLAALAHNMQTLKQLIEQNQLTQGDFWGYGINHISDGQEEHSSVDVEVIKRTEGMNKHHEPYRNLLLLLFKVEKGVMWVSTFSIDTCAPTVNSNINTRYSLLKFEHARMRTRGQAIFVDIFFTDATKPVSFQVDTYHLGRNYLSNNLLADFYIKSVTELALTTDQNHDPVLSMDDRHILAANPSTMNISGTSRQVLSHLYEERRENGNTYGSISFNMGLGKWEKAKELCEVLYKHRLAELRGERVFITDTGCKWIEEFKEKQEDRIREFVYDDYDFALFRFLYELDLPLALKDFPEILMDEAPKYTTGSSSMNLYNMLEFKLKSYVHSPQNKYELKPSGRKYFEHLAKKKSIPLIVSNDDMQKKNASRIFISYAHKDGESFAKVQLHLKALKNYGQIEIDYWDDTRLISGDKWESLIAKELNEADIAILLVSAPFFASDFIKAKELAPLLKNAEQRGTRIIPLIVGHCMFTTSPISQFQAVNDPSNPLYALSDAEQDKILVKMCRDIETHLMKNRAIV